MNIQEFFKSSDKLKNKTKIIVLLISITIIVGAYTFLERIVSGKTEIDIPENNFLPINEILKSTESLITIRVSNSSKYVLDSINSVVYVDVLASGENFKSKIVTRNAKLIKISREKSDLSEEIEYILSLILDKSEAQKIFNLEQNSSFSILINSKGKEESLAVTKSFEESGEVEIIEEGGESEDEN